MTEFLFLFRGSQMASRSPNQMQRTLRSGAISPEWASLYERIVKSEQDLDLAQSRKSVYTNLAHSVVGTSRLTRPELAFTEN